MGQDKKLGAGDVLDLLGRAAKTALELGKQRQEEVVGALKTSWADFQVEVDDLIVEAQDKALGGGQNCAELAERLRRRQREAAAKLEAAKNAGVKDLGQARRELGEALSQLQGAYRDVKAELHK